MIIPKIMLSLSVFVVTLIILCIPFCDRLSYKMHIIIEKILLGLTIITAICFLIVSNIILWVS